MPLPDEMSARRFARRGFEAPAGADARRAGPTPVADAALEDAGARARRAA
ncbi:hypothetical protein [Jannaschia sp. W003]|nr:hypothetical protein [Jannaschia sp. W003]UWQ21780.1 hypothetical protein K3554_01750 [Jannaschia sp. W003]